jgi:hypothetical protein
MEEFVKYLITTLERNLSKEKRDSIWTWCIDIIRQEQISVYSLENMANNNLTKGIFGGENTSLNRRSLIRLAEAIGVVGVQNPEGGQHGLFPRKDGRNYPDSDLLDMIEEEVGFQIELPEFIGGREVLKTNRGVLTDRHCHYLWLTKRIIELCPSRHSSIIEIGPGLGLLPYFLHKAGYKDYTGIDFAYSNLIQAYFLRRNLPEARMLLSGEVKNPFHSKYANRIKFLHASDFINVPTLRFDLMINMDGLTEMIIDEAQKYFNSSCTARVLSINHEVNNYRIVDIHKPKRKLIYRYPFWTREGYVEELYENI